MFDQIANLIVLLAVAIISAFLFHYFTIRRSERERKVSKKDAEIKRIEGLLYHIEKINIAANFPQQDESNKLLQKAFQWFDENCLPHRYNEPYKKFNIMLKWVDGYITNPDLFTKAEVSEFSALDMFKEIIALRKELTRILEKMKSNKK